MSEQFYVYIVTNKPKGTLYIGVTSDLARRISEHRIGEMKGFTKRYNLKRLVYYETYGNPETAIAREKRLKTWLRQWKTELVEQQNPAWDDLFPVITA